MVRRDRNHPSVILWEPILNETGYTEEFARTVYRIVHEEYPGDQCYAASDANRPFADHYDVLYGRQQSGSKPVWTREWGDSVDNWDDQNGPYRVRRAFGEGALLREVMGHERAMERQYAVPGIGGFGLWAASMPSAATITTRSGADSWIFSASPSSTSTSSPASALRTSTSPVWRTAP